MIINYITSFAEYLNKTGYQVTNDKIARFLEMFYDSGADFSDTDDVVSIMKLTFCKDKEESMELPALFHRFREDYESI